MTIRSTCVQFVKWAPFEVDVTDAMMLLRHVTKPLAWLPEESVNLELSAVGQGKVRGLILVLIQHRRPPNHSI